VLIATLTALIAIGAVALSRPDHRETRLAQRSQVTQDPPTSTETTTVPAPAAAESTTSTEASTTTTLRRSTSNPTTAVSTTAPTRAASSLLDGEQLTFFDGDGGISTMRLDGSERKQVLDLRPVCPCTSKPWWSPDATRFVFALFRDARLTSYIGDLRTGTLSPGPSAVPFGWTADGANVVWRVPGQKAYVGMPDGTVVRDIAKDNAVTALFELSSRRHLYVFHGFVDGYDGEVLQVADVAVADSARVVVPRPWGGMYGSASPDERSIVFRGWRVTGKDSTGGWTYADEGLTIVDLDSGAVRSLCDCTGVRPRWSPRGDLIADMGGASMPAKILLYSPAGGAPRELGSAQATDLEWSPDGRSLLVRDGDNSLRVWDVDTGRELPIGAKGLGAAFVVKP
jgi:WD40 repeat protein